MECRSSIVLTLFSLLREVNFKKESFILVLTFQCKAGLPHCWLEVRSVWRACKRKAASLKAPHSPQEAERERGQWQDTPFEGTPQWPTASKQTHLLTDHSVWTHRWIIPLKGLASPWSNHWSIVPIAGSISYINQDTVREQHCRCPLQWNVHD
jgi:hypothetical protein